MFDVHTKSKLFEDFSFIVDDFGFSSNVGGI